MRKQDKMKNIEKQKDERNTVSRDRFTEDQNNRVVR